MMLPLLFIFMLIFHRIPALTLRPPERPANQWSVGLMLTNERSGHLVVTNQRAMRPEKPSLDVDIAITSASKNSLRHPRTTREARCDAGPGHQRRCVFPFSMWSRTFTTCTTYDGDDRFEYNPSLSLLMEGHGHYFNTRCVNNRSWIFYLD